MRITNEIERIVEESGVKHGLILINPMHDWSFIKQGIWGRGSKYFTANLTVEGMKGLWLKLLVNDLMHFRKLLENY